MPALCLTVSVQGERPSLGPIAALAANTPAASYQTPGVRSGEKGVGKGNEIYMYDERVHMLRTGNRLKSFPVSALS